LSGSSSAPQKLLAPPTNTGGAMPRTYGVPVDGLRRIDTDLRVTIIGQLSRVLAERKV
jgi:hypothetical protein